MWGSAESVGLVESVESVESKKVFSSNGGLWYGRLLISGVVVTLVWSNGGSDL